MERLVAIVILWRVRMLNRRIETLGKIGMSENKLAEAWRREIRKLKAILHEPDVLDVP